MFSLDYEHSLFDTARFLLGIWQFRVVDMNHPIITDTLNIHPNTLQRLDLRKDAITHISIVGYCC